LNVVGDYTPGSRRRARRSQANKLLTIVTNIYALVTYFLAGLRPTGGTAAPMFWTILATLGVFLVLAARSRTPHGPVSRMRRSWR